MVLECRCCYFNMNCTITLVLFIHKQQQRTTNRQTDTSFCTHLSLKPQWRRRSRDFRPSAVYPPHAAAAVSMERGCCLRSIIYCSSSRGWGLAVLWWCAQRTEKAVGQNLLRDARTYVTIANKCFRTAALVGRDKVSTLASGLPPGGGRCFFAA